MNDVQPRASRRNPTWSRQGRQPRIAIIGAGFSGIGAIIKLREQGFSDLTCYEKADRIGGTWRDNHYPGLSCDVPSHWYCYTFERNPNWSHRFSYGREIWDYMNAVADKYGVKKYIQFNNGVSELRYVGPEWRLTTEHGVTATYDVIVAATGVLVHPSYPDIPGLDTFAGDQWHSARWRDDVSLGGKRVGVIGTGSTSCQIVGAIADDVQHLDVFQRTPQWIYPMPQREYTNSWRFLLKYAPGLQQGIRRFFRWYAEHTFGQAVMGDAKQQAAIQQECEKHLEEQIPDPVLRKKLTPHYKATCKRLILCSTFYPALMRDNVDLVTDGVKEIVPAGVMTKDGALRPLDVLVLATGFQAGNFILPTRVVGENGVELGDFWRGSPRAHRAMTFPGFPNFFMLEGPTGVFGNTSLIELAEYQIGYMISCLKEMERRHASVFAPTHQAFHAYNEELAEGIVGTTWATGGCDSWYLDASGLPNLYPFHPSRYRYDMTHPDFSEYRLEA